MAHRLWTGRTPLPRTLLPCAVLAAAVVVAGCVSPGSPPAGAAKTVAREVRPPAAPQARPIAAEREWNQDTVAGDGFAVGPDVRVFALFAWLNGVAGYDAEPQPPMDPLRLGLRSDLAAALRTVRTDRLARWRGFSSSHRLPVERYVSCALSLDMPPAFRAPKAAGQQGCTAGLDGFDRILSEFWEEAGLEALYQRRYRDEIARLAARYDPMALGTDLALVQGYMHAPGRDSPRVRVRIVPNPFSGRGFSYSAARGRDLLVIEAPAETPARIDAVAWVRLAVGPIVAASAGARSPVVEGIVAANRDKPLVKGIREAVPDFVTECLARAAGYRIEQARAAGRDAGLLDTLWKKARQDSDGGLALVPWFFAELARFEADESMGMAEFVESALARLAK